MKARLIDDIDIADVRPGDIEFLSYPDGVAGGYAYCCPGCGKVDYLPIDDGAKGWIFDGNVSSPTLRPSILHRSCGWHGYLTAGEFIPC